MIRRRELSCSCCPQELESLPLTTVWVMWELELWASVTSILFFFLAGCWLGNPMWYTFELIPHWLEGSVPVLCEQSGLPVCNQMLPNGYKSLCVLWDQMYQMRRGPWSLIIAIIRLMCCLALIKVYDVRWNPWQCGTLFEGGHMTPNQFISPKVVR